MMVCIYIYIKDEFVTSRFHLNPDNFIQNNHSTCLILFLFLIFNFLKKAIFNIF